MHSRSEAAKAVELKLTERERQAKQWEERLIEEAQQQSRIRLVPQIQAALTEYNAVLLDRKVSQLQQTLAECFNKLARKKDVVKRILIDARTFGVQLCNGHERPLAKAQLSAGEKQIYAVAVLWALARISGKPLPLIIDTPLGRLDSDHRRMLISDYFPVASHQVIILSTDTEVDRTYFAQLKPFVARAYRLEFDMRDRTTTVVPGYFFEEACETH